MAYTDDYTLSQDAVFQGRVKIAMLVAALSVANETPSGIAETDELRHQLAVRILNAPDDNNLNFVYSVVSNVAITAQSIDSDIQFTVNSNFGAIAGVRVGIVQK